MGLINPSKLFLFVIIIIPIDSLAEGFQAYSQEVSFLKLMLGCQQEKIVTPMRGFGALYICALGDKKTVKLYVSEKPNSGRVQNIGLLWNDKEINIGYGVHSDTKEAEEALDFLVDMYVPTSKDEIKKAFWDSKTKDFSTSDFLIYVTFKTSPQKDKLLISIEEK